MSRKSSCVHGLMEVGGFEGHSFLGEGDSLWVEGKPAVLPWWEGFQMLPDLESVSFGLSLKPSLVVCSLVATWQTCPVPAVSPVQVGMWLMVPPPLSPACLPPTPVYRY